jgi:hypothetical protein
MAHRSKRKHVKHVHEHEPAAHKIEPIAGLPSDNPSIPRMLGDIARSIARRIVHRLLERPRRMLAQVRAALGPR